MASPSTVWFSSDHHFGHRNIIDYCNRPFRSVDGAADPDAMNAALIAAHNDTVGEHDEVWFLGDVALGRIRDTLPLVRQCAGRKVLTVGNHDRCFRRDGREHPTADAAYLQAGFASLTHGTGELTLPEGPRVLVSHFPYTGDSQTVDRYPHHRPADDGHTWLLCGHVHDLWRQRGRMINVGVDAWGGRPVSSADVFNLIQEGPADRDPLPWL